jgi:hypothetical protein
LTGQAGSFNAFLYALGCVGFGLKSVTSITVSGGVATVLFSAPHAAEEDSVILLDGIIGSLTGLNGEQKITSKPAAGELRFATSEADGTATGTITMKMAPWGMTRVFQSGEVSVYKFNDPMSNGHFLRVDDSHTLDVRVSGYETMTDVSTGTNKFPAPSQIKSATPDSGGYWTKTVLANANPVSWNAIGDTRIFMYAPQAYQSNWPVGETVLRPKFIASGFRGFGDPIALRPAGDPFGTMLGCADDVNHISLPYSGSFSQAITSYGGLYSPRSHTGLGTSVQNTSMNYSAVNTVDDFYSGMASSGLGSFPSSIDGALRMVKRFIRRRAVTTAQDYAPRADVPGLVYLPHSECTRYFPERSIIKGSGQWEGRNLMAIPIATSYSNNVLDSPDTSGVILVDKTGPWRV